MSPHGIDKAGCPDKLKIDVYRIMQLNMFSYWLLNLTSCSPTSGATIGIVGVAI